MNWISNIWNHPKTSATGLLIAIVTIAGVLSQQGITLGKAGTGTVVTLAGALATALLGLLARDPAPQLSSTNSTAKLGVWALIALLLPLPLLGGCTPPQISEVESAVNVVIDAAASVEGVLGNTAIATDLEAAAQGLKTAEANFAAGAGTEVAISNAALAVEDVLAEIDPNSNASVMADILTTALDELLALLPAPTASAASLHRTASATPYYNHHSRPDGKIKHVWGRSMAGDFKASFNRAAKNVGAKTI